MRTPDRTVDGSLEIVQRSLARIAGDVLDLCESESDRAALRDLRAPPQRHGESPRQRSARENACDEARRAFGYLRMGNVRFAAAHTAAARAWAAVLMLDERTYSASHERVRQGLEPAPLRHAIREAWAELALMCTQLGPEANRQLRRIAAEPRPDWARILEAIKKAEIAEVPVDDAPEPGSDG